MSPLPSKSLIWSHEPITSSPESAAIGNFHQLPDATGFMLNSILNVQSLDHRQFGGFRRTGLDLLTHADMQRAVSTILGEPGKLVQSMYCDAVATDGYRKLALS